MAFRGNEMGMDFEYENRTGPMDSRSPFARVGHNAQRFPPQQTSMNKSRNFGAFDSPQKSQIPSLHHNSPGKPLPQVPGNAYDKLFSTPRKINTFDFDDSSAGETPRSPERDDSNAPTPENMGLRSAIAKWNVGGKSQSQSQQSLPGAEKEQEPEVKEEREERRPSPKKRDSFLVRMRDKWQSPGRGELLRAEKSERNGAIVKRKRGPKSKKRRHEGSDSDEDRELQRHKSSRKASRQKPSEDDANRPHWITNLFTFIGQHPTVPHILSFYAQLAFNVFLLALLAYTLYCFWSAVQGDVDKKAYEAMAEVMAESRQCLHEWNANKCDRATRMPALEAMCENWQTCMNRDASKIGRARVSAHTFAEIFNSFVEPISWKAMIFTTFIVFGGFATTNMAFGFFRDRAQHQHQQIPQQYFPPPTPQRSFSGQPGEGYYGTPWHQQQQALEPQPSPTRSPTKRIAY